MAYSRDLAFGINLRCRSMPAHAWSDRPVTIIVPFAPGKCPRRHNSQGGTSPHGGLDQRVVIQNVSGASGAIGVERTVHAEPDGHALVMSGDAALVVRLSMQPPLPYDPRRDLLPITLVARTPNLLAVRAADGPRSLAELVTSARTARGSFNYGHAGPGTSIQPGAELLIQMAGIQLTGIRYPSMAGIQQDVLAGRLDLAFVPALTAGPMVRDGQLRALAISSPGGCPSFPMCRA